MNKKGQPLTKHIKMAKGGHVKSRGKALRGGGAEIKPSLKTTGLQNLKNLKG